MIDGTCAPVIGLGSKVVTSTFSTGARKTSPPEVATPDSSSTRADGNGLASVDLDLRVRGIL